MSKQIYIYGLYDPFTQELRYIGKTKMTLAKRVWHHIKEAKVSKKNTHKLNWIRSVLNRGGEPIIHALRQTDAKNWREDESECISEALLSGVNLTNLTAGGDGLVDYHHSKETKKKISDSNKKVGRIPPNWKGRKQSPEHIRKRVEARRRNGTYEVSQETRKLISRKNTGKNLGNTHTLGMKHTEEWKQAASERMKGEENPFYGRRHSEEVKRKISIAKQGGKASDETKAKLSAAQQARTRKNQTAHIAKIAIPYSELITMSDDPQINEIYRLYVGGMTKMEIMRHLGYKGTGGRFYRKMSKAIKAIPVIEDGNE